MLNLAGTKISREDSERRKKHTNGENTQKAEDIDGLPLRYPVLCDPIQNVPIDSVEEVWTAPRPGSKVQPMDYSADHKLFDRAENAYTD